MLKLWRRASNYVRHDLREIVAPSSLPDPPGLPDDPPPRTWAESWAVRPLLPMRLDPQHYRLQKHTNTSQPVSLSWNATHRSGPPWHVHQLECARSQGETVVLQCTAQSGWAGSPQDLRIAVTASLSESVHVSSHLVNCNAVRAFLHSEAVACVVRCSWPSRGLGSMVTPGERRSLSRKVKKLPNRPRRSS